MTVFLAPCSLKLPCYHDVISAIVCSAFRPIGGPAMVLVRFMGFVWLHVFAVVNRQPSELPVGSRNHDNQILAFFSQPWNTQYNCWHFPVVKQWHRTQDFPTVHFGSEHIVFSACSREILRGWKVWLMCKYTINNASRIWPNRLSSLAALAFSLCWVSFPPILHPSLPASLEEIKISLFNV